MGRADLRPPARPARALNKKVQRGDGVKAGSSYARRAARHRGSSNAVARLWGRQADSSNAAAALAAFASFHEVTLHQLAVSDYTFHPVHTHYIYG
jgi:hypothetical protein